MRAHAARSSCSVLEESGRRLMKGELRVDMLSFEYWRRCECGRECVCEGVGSGVAFTCVSDLEGTFCVRVS